MDTPHTIKGRPRFSRLVSCCSRAQLVPSCARVTLHVRQSVFVSCCVFAKLRVCL